MFRFYKLLLSSWVFQASVLHNLEVYDAHVIIYEDLTLFYFETDFCFKIDEVRLEMEINCYLNN